MQVTLITDFISSTNVTYDDMISSTCTYDVHPEYVSYRYDAS